MVDLGLSRKKKPFYSYEPLFICHCCEVFLVSIWNLELSTHFSHLAGSTERTNEYLIHQLSASVEEIGLIFYVSHDAYFFVCGGRTDF